MRSRKIKDIDQEAGLNIGTKAGEGKEPSLLDIGWQVPTLSAGCAKYNLIFAISTWSFPVFHQQADCLGYCQQWTLLTCPSLHPNSLCPQEALEIKVFQPVFIRLPRVHGRKFLALLGQSLLSFYQHLCLDSHQASPKIIATEFSLPFPCQCFFPFGLGYIPQLD